MKRFLYIALFLLIFLAADSCSRKGRVIPPHKLAEIYAEMLVADQWVRTENTWTKEADTTLFYEPIFEKYGFTTKDYQASVIHYMADPESFGEIFKEAKSILDLHVDEMTAEERAANYADSISKALAAKNFRRAPVYLDWNDSLRMDTVHISIDTAGIYSWEKILQDTLYSGPSFSLPADTALVKDTVAVGAVDKKASQSTTLGRSSLKIDGERYNPVSGRIDTRIIAVDKQLKRK